MNSPSLDPACTCMFREAAQAGAAVRAQLDRNRAAAAKFLPAIEAHPLVEPLLLVQSFYRAANALAIARGCDPDRPPHLDKITRTT